jgi:sterol 3beta-glucosyltransferase
VRVRIITIGAQGDVRPGVAFGAALQAAGHDVRIVSHPGFEGLVRRRGLDFAPVAGDPRDLAKEENLQLRALHNGGRNLLQWWRTFKEVDVPLLHQRFRDCWEACEDSEVIVASVLPYIFGYAIAEKLQIPLVRSFYFPVSPTRSHPIDFWPRWFRLPGSLNLATYHAQRQLIWEVARPWVTRACREVLGLRSLPRREPFGDLDRQQQLLLYAYSPSVAPPPADWGAWIDVTGYWFLERSTEWTPPPALRDFLDAGPPPVCIGFGSMTYDRNELIRTIEDALALTGQRAVLLAGWGGLRPPELPRNMITIDWVPLTWLFARMAAVVHHGGAGTTAESIRAGVPTVVVPFFYDQFFWGRRVFEIGAGPRPILRKHLAAKTLANAIQIATTDLEMRRRAAAVGARIRIEDGVGRAVATFERHLCPTGGKQPATVGDAGRPVPPGRTLLWR